MFGSPRRYDDSCFYHCALNPMFLLDGIMEHRILQPVLDHRKRYFPDDKASFSVYLRYITYTHGMTRALLGLLQGGFIPDVVLYLSYFYTKRERKCIRSHPMFDDVRTSFIALFSPNASSVLLGVQLSRRDSGSFYGYRHPPIAWCAWEVRMEIPVLD